MRFHSSFARRAGVFGLLLAAAALCSAAPPTTRKVEGLRVNRPSWYALTGATVVTGPGQSKPAVIVIRDGVIVQVGGETPAGAKVIDLAGKTIYPGLIDAYSEFKLPAEALRQGATYWNSEVRSHVSVSEHYSASGATDQDYRSQGVVARLVAPDDGILRGQSCVVSTGDEKRDQRILRDSVAQHALLTLRRGDRNHYPNSPMGAVALARQAVIDADWLHAAERAHEADRSLPRPEQCDTLSDLHRVLEGQPMVFQAQNELFALRADRFAREFGIKAFILGSGHEYKRLEEIAKLGRPLIVPLNFPKAPNVATRETEREATLEELMHWDLAPENPARLAAAGATIAVTAHGLDSPKGLLKAVREAVQRGLSKQDALRALTVSPAELLGVDTMLGTIETGKQASLVVVDGDLFEKGTVVETWVAGQRFEMKTAPWFDLAGPWDMKIDGIEPALRVEFKTKDKLTADAKTQGESPKSVALSQVALSGSRLSLQLEGETLGKPGAARLSALVNATGDQWQGIVTWPDHSESSVSAARAAAQPDQPKQQSSPETPEPKEAKATKTDPADAAELPADEPKRKKKRGKKARKAARDTVEPTEEKQSTAETDKTDKQADQSAKADNADGPDQKSDKKDQDDKANEPAKASFAVNYPLGAYGRESAPEQPMVLFTNATVWTCGPQGILENGAVLIRDGRVVAVRSTPPSAQGRENELRRLFGKAAEQATVVDLQGRHLSPGIIDCHSHMATDGGINESAQAITSEVRIGDFINCDDIDIYRQLAGGVTAANILHGSANPIGGQNQVIKLRWGATPDGMKFAEAPQGIKFALGENVKQSNWGDEYTSRYPQTRMGVVEIVQDTFRSAREYRDAQLRWRQQGGMPVRRDLELEAIVEILEGDRWIHCHSYRQDEILALLRTLDEYHVTIGTFQHILEGYKVADAMAKHGAMGSAFSDWWAYKFEVFDAIPYNGSLMHNAGVVVSFNSDDRELARRLNTEAAKAVKYGGVPPEEAFKFVTLNPAKQLRIDRYVGSIERGKHADLVVWSGSPLSTFSRCEQTWVDGRKYFDREEDLRQRAVWQQRRETLVQKILQSGKPMMKPGERQPDPTALWPSSNEYCHHSGSANQQHTHRH
ncbi:MAG: amidohydrolase family protein [Planctomycetales bacterium]|nr:amidohydrolase family protein [Planctomycetales bacterium]